ncbi:MAG: DUF4197 domain-containing protein [Alphaproteobacteria bacterium]|nr:DUF4197 domain-containing protein [Alphaproteobacteria bacterium]MCZ6510818.1 DUF4197 domain-containing protein [Alphaproteobacteria bacterium]MCZ6838053.1 DUF4197 domain-containing protein [Alphaproteobacteria bacterium]
MTLKQLALSFAATVAIVSIPLGAQAQLDLLKRGKDALQSIQGSGESGGSSSTSGVLTDQEIGSGLREALTVGVRTVVSQVGATDGYNADPRIHVPLPKSLETVQKTLSRIGMSDLVDDLELRLNRAAEQAAPEAREVFGQAIQEMTFDDVQMIYNGPDDAATRFLERTMSDPLIQRMRPIVDASLSEVGAVRAYDNAIGQYKAIPFVPDAKADLTQHVLERALKGLFLYLAEEEAAIRQNPVKRTTDLLQKVFGAS